MHVFLVISILIRIMLMSNLVLCKFSGLYITNQSLVTLDDLHTHEHTHTQLHSPHRNVFDFSVQI